MTATLRLLDADAARVRHTLTLRIGVLDPVESVSGVQQRLRRLGLACGHETTLGPGTREVLARFQTLHDLDVTGEPDDVTRRKLVELAGV